MLVNDSATLGSLIYDLNWLSKSAANYKHNWKKLNSIEALFEFNKKYSNYKIDVYMVISNVATDTKLEKYSEMHECIDEFVTLTCECINNPYTRIKVEFSDEDESNSVGQEFEVLFTKNLICIIGLLMSLYQLSISEQLKLEIYNKTGLNEALKKLLYEGNDIEKHAVLTQLSFESNVKASLVEENELAGFVEGLLNKKNAFSLKKLKLACESFLLNLKKDVEKNSAVISDLNNQHIMISYNSGKLLYKLSTY